MKDAVMSWVDEVKDFLADSWPLTSIAGMAGVPLWIMAPPSSMGWPTMTVLCGILVLFFGAFVRCTDIYLTSSQRFGWGIIAWVTGIGLFITTTGYP